VDLSAIAGKTSSQAKFDFGQTSFTIFFVRRYRCVYHSFCLFRQKINN